jgi:UDP-galactopyranose mutase
MKRYAIVGAGLTGLSVGVCLRDKDPDCQLTFYEATRHLGGLLKRQYIYGIGYDLGGHIWHSRESNVDQFFRRFFDLNDYKHRAMSLTDEGQLVSWPACSETLDSFSLKVSNKIKGDMKEYVRIQSPQNFKQAVMNELRSDILYEALVHGYTKKMWGREPEDLDISFAPKRIKWNTDSNFFDDPYQGYPFSHEGYDLGLSLMKDYIDGQFIFGCQATINTFSCGAKYDKIFLTCRPDIFLFTKADHMPALKYYGIEVVPQVIWGQQRFQELATINFSGLDIPALRCTEFNHFNGHIDRRGTVIAYDYPTHDSGKGLQCYPDPTPSSRRLHQQYVDIVKEELPNSILVGRLAEYRYMNMDECVKSAMEVVELV